jgi:hypothetical protein
LNGHATLIEKNAPGQTAGIMKQKKWQEGKQFYVLLTTAAESSFLKPGNFNEWEYFCHFRTEAGSFGYIGNPVSFNQLFFLINTGRRGC